MEPLLILVPNLAQYCLATKRNFLTLNKRHCCDVIQFCHENHFSSKKSQTFTLILTLHAHLCIFYCLTWWDNTKFDMKVSGTCYVTWESRISGSPVDLNQVFQELRKTANTVVGSFLIPMSPSQLQSPPKLPLPKYHLNQNIKFNKNDGVHDGHVFSQNLGAQLALKSPNFHNENLFLGQFTSCEVHSLHQHQIW